MLSKEELACKYLKYNKSITEDIFDKIVLKLKSYNLNYSINSSYKDFCHDSGYLFIGSSSFHTSRGGALSEISVEDIIDIKSTTKPSETPSNELTIGNLLDECNKRYPIGTKYKSARNGSYGKAEHEARFVFEDDDDVGKCGVEVGNGYCYYKGKWAEVIVDDEPIDELLSEDYSCNDIKKDDMDFYVEVENQEQADLVFKWLESKGEKIIEDEGQNRRVQDDYIFIVKFNEDDEWWVGHEGHMSGYRKEFSEIEEEMQLSGNIEHDSSNTINTGIYTSPGLLSDSNCQRGLYIVGFDKEESSDDCYKTIKPVKLRPKNKSRVKINNIKVNISNNKLNIKLKK